MYIISIELVRFSALSPMVLEGTTSQFAQPNRHRHGGYHVMGGRLFLCHRKHFSNLPCPRVFLYSLRLQHSEAVAIY
jgi:hypothetical protein